MKDTIWNFLTVMTLLVTLLLGIVFLQIFYNPNSALNPFAPPPLPELIVLPSPTATLRSLPQVWTNTPSGGVVLPDEATATLRPSSTPLSSPTSFILSTWTPTPTNTATPTNTFTPTLTPTQTLTSTVTMTPTETLTPMSTSTPTVTLDPNVAPTETFTPVADS